MLFASSTPPTTSTFQLSKDVAVWSLRVVVMVFATARTLRPGDRILRRARTRPTCALRRGTVSRIATGACPSRSGRTRKEGCLRELARPPGRPRLGFAASGAAPRWRIEGTIYPPSRCRRRVAAVTETACPGPDAKRAYGELLRPPLHAILCREPTSRRGWRAASSTPRRSPGPPSARRPRRPHTGRGSPAPRSAGTRPGTSSAWPRASVCRE